MDAESTPRTTRLGPRMGLIMYRPQSRDRHMGVQLRGRQTGMAEQLLDDTQLGAAVEEVGGERVA